MAPGIKLHTPHPYDSPMGRNIQRIVREMLKKELTMEAKAIDGHVHIQLMLKDKPIANPVKLRLKWLRDRGHGGGYYVDGLTLEQ